MGPLVLGSASPRRREILRAMGVPHVVRPRDVDETVQGRETPERYLERVVRAKLEAVCVVSASGEPVLVADTSVVLDDEILGKPNSIITATTMLMRLAGRAHNVMTRFALGVYDDSKTCLMHAETVNTEVIFRELAEDELLAYATSGEGLDKAGAYAIQGGASAFVREIHGSYSNVVGLPACEVAVALRRLSWL